MSSDEQSLQAIERVSTHLPPVMTMIPVPLQYCLNAPLAVAEIIDGEAVAMNMDTGRYFSARGLAGVLWAWTIAGHAVSDISAAVTAKWPVPGVDVDVTAFVVSILSHNVVVPSAAPPSTAIDRTLLDLPAYVAPVLDVFTDMKDLLLPDPIHDVGEARWPMPLSTGALAPG